MKFLLLLSGLILFGACQTESHSEIDSNDKRKLEELHEKYKKFWLENDSMKVVNLYSEDGAIVPPGKKGDVIKGRKNIGAWWFTPTGDTTYPITTFNYKNDTLIVSGNLAVWEGISNVEWATRTKDSLITSQSSSTNFITVCKKENGEWTIYRQIWNVIPN